MWEFHETLIKKSKSQTYLVQHTFSLSFSFLTGVQNIANHLKVIATYGSFQNINISAIITYKNKIYSWWINRADRANFSHLLENKLSCSLLKTSKPHVV